ncbi:MAG TPA: pantoate--beta-alanine ligase [Chitinophagaceae bacterium]|nr:pantoate--beta-alanine ligase [Chitinophagaceae bacterium]
MLIFNNVVDLRENLDILQKKDKSIGFVPTMGALHEGHLSLVHAAARLTDQVVCSIFVNPTQFTDQADFDRYPSSPERDIKILETVPADILFMPPVHQMYPEGLTGLSSYPLGYLGSILEGHFRPGHFQGVAQAVDRLNSIVRPDILLLGQKDYQQCLIIRHLVEFLPWKPRIEICPTLREQDGLAMSSRNRRLDPMSRSKAPALYQALQYVRDHLETLPFHDLKKDAVHQLDKAGFTVDYLEIAHQQTLHTLENPGNGDPIVILAAGRIGGIRLIDNLLI